MSRTGEARSDRDFQWALNCMRGPRPVSTAVRPWPGIYVGAGVVAFGVLVPGDPEAVQ